MDDYHTSTHDVVLARI